MKPERVFLFDFCGTTHLSTNLRRILGTQFPLTIITNQEFQRLEVLLTSDSYLEGKHADRCLAFLITDSASLAESKSFLVSLKNSVPQLAVITAIEATTPEDALELMELGASDFITAPFQPADVLARVRKEIARPREAHPTSAAEPHAKKLIGKSPVFLQQISKIPLIANCEANVLISGPTGTGKELYARAIHYGSARAGKPFMPVNCGAIPVELVENELFGHRRGAFTSAASSQIGLIEEAHGGTLFLDEIDCLPVSAQVKLLRFLQEKEYRPLGSAQMRRADVRIIAASNIDLELAVGNGKVRQDLFYRLNIISVSMPALCNRRDDIPLLANHFFAKYAQEGRHGLTGFSTEALHLLMVQPWPGNVRELEHVIQRAVVLCEGEVIQTSDLLLSNSQLAPNRESLQEAKAKEIARFEKNYIQAVLSICKGNITRAAVIARKNRRAFWELIRKHQIDVSRFKQTST